MHDEREWVMHAIYEENWGVRNTERGTRESIHNDAKVGEHTSATVPRALPVARLVFWVGPKSEGVFASRCTSRQNDAPISHGLLPTLQLRDLVHLEPKDARTVPLRPQRDRSRVDRVPKGIRSLHQFLARSSAPARIVHRRTGARHEADCA